MVDHNIVFAVMAVAIVILLRSYDLFENSDRWIVCVVDGICIGVIIVGYFIMAFF